MEKKNKTYIYIIYTYIRTYIHTNTKQRIFNGEFVSLKKQKVSMTGVYIFTPKLNIKFFS